MLNATVLILLLSTALAEAPPPIVGGERTDGWPAVGALVVYDEDRGGAPFCSGTLVAERWVLTAAHCLEAADGWVEEGFDLVFAVGDDIYTQGGLVDVVYAEDWHAHPDYSGMEARPIRGDAGLIELERPVKGALPVGLNTRPPDGSWAGEPLDYVGWGITSDQAEDAGRKRHVEVSFADSDERFIYGWEAGRNFCSGDSGGAVFLPSSGDGPVLAGIASFVFSLSEEAPPCAEGGAGAYRVDPLIGWVGEHVEIRESSNGVAWVGEPREGGGGLPADTAACSTGPGRGSLGGLAILGGLLWARRRPGTGSPRGCST